MAFPPRDKPVARVGRGPLEMGRERSGPPERKSLAPRSATITVMIRAAFAAAKTLKRDFGEVEHLQVSEKGPGDFVSRADIMAERTLRKEPARALVGTGIPHMGRGDHATYTDKLQAVMDKTAGVRRWGAAALDLAFVAAGRFDAFFEYGLAPWDVAAGILMVREAGGLVNEIPGGAYVLGTSASILATNAGLRDTMVEILA